VALKTVSVLAVDTVEAGAVDVLPATLPDVGDGFGFVSTSATSVIPVSSFLLELPLRADWPLASRS
jgi:hypothetical protein